MTTSHPANCTPSIQFSAGTRLGISSKASFLCECSDPIHLQHGLHLIVAPNGLGKSTLLRSVAGLSPLLSGKVTTSGRIEYFSDHLRADDEVRVHMLFYALFRKDALNYALQLSDGIGLDVQKRFGELSRGNRQKAILILAEAKVRFCKERTILLMDEPLAGIDMETCSKISELWSNSPRHILRWVVTHELASMQKADSLTTISNGRLIKVDTANGCSLTETYRQLHQ